MRRPHPVPLWRKASRYRITRGEAAKTHAVAGEPVEWSGLLDRSAELGDPPQPARKPKPWHRMSSGAPIRSSARYDRLMRIDDVDNHRVSMVTQSSRRRAAISTSAMRASARAASASSRGRRVCTSSTAPSVEPADHTKRPKAPRSTSRVPRSRASGVDLDSASMNDLGGNNYQAQDG